MANTGGRREVTFDTDVVRAGTRCQRPGESPIPLAKPCQPSSTAVLLGAAFGALLAFLDSTIVNNSASANAIDGNGPPRSHAAHRSAATSRNSPSIVSRSRWRQRSRRAEARKSVTGGVSIRLIKAACRRAANWPRVALGRGNRMTTWLGFVMMNVFIVAWWIPFDIKDWPGWAFERAHRGSKRSWLVAWFLCLFVPLGSFVHAFAWRSARKAVKRARDLGDPNAADEARRRTAEMHRRRNSLDTQARNQYNAQRPIGSPPWQGFGPPPTY
jgi:hypothetical protein